MALFKEATCSHCGGKTNIITRYRIDDNQYVCSKCVSEIPAIMLSNAKELTYNQFELLYDRMNTENAELAQVFKETHSYKGIHLDTIHNLYYLDHISPRAYLKLEEIGSFLLEFIADEVKEGFWKDTVTGRVYLKIENEFPIFTFDKVIAEKVKSNARIKEGIFKKKVTYAPPADLDTFRNIFALAWNDARESFFERLTQELVKENYGGIFSNRDDT